MITKEDVVDLCNKLGTPFYFNYHHGLTVVIKPDFIFVGQFGEFKFEISGHGMVDITPTHVTFERPALGRPDNLIIPLQECLLIKQNETGAVLGWLCWR